MELVCIIPARLGSERFPRKVLAPLKGKPLIQWSYEAAKNCGLFDRVVIALDSEELKSAVEDFGAETLLTSPSCQSGTERLVELYKEKKISSTLWVNWQADEPFITRELIETLLQSSENPSEEIWTLKRKITSPDQITSPHVVKVVCQTDGRALYFSRRAIPYGAAETFYKHVGLYAFRESALAKIAEMPPSSLEKAEKLEQLRFLENGMNIRVHETDKEIFGIDTKEELFFAEQYAILGGP